MNLYVRQAWLSLRQVNVMARAYALPKRWRRRRARLISELHRIEVQRIAVKSMILIKRADRLNVERPHRPALVNDQIAVDYRSDWIFDPATRLTYLTFDATKRVRGSIRATTKERFDLRKMLRS